MKRWIETIGMAAIAMAVASSCAPKGPKGGFQMPPTPVEVSEVRRDVVRDQFKALGSIEANEIVKVTNEVAAVVRSLPFAEGQSVARGQLLAQLDDAEIGADAHRAEALRDQAKTAHARIQQLFDQKAASPQELDDASAAFKVADANFQLANARYEKTRIRSPLDGVVGRRLVSPGAYLRVGDEITEVASVDHMKLTFSAPERYLSHLKRGAEVEITTTVYPGRMFHGHVTVVDPILDPTTRTVQIVALVDNPGRVLRSGMSADVSATLAERQDALTVPDEAVFAEGDQNYVYVVLPDSNIAKRRAIVIGTRDSSRVEVTSGLAVHDQVVRAGYQKLFDGAKVMPVSETGAPAGAGGAVGAAADTKPAATKTPAPAARARGQAAKPATGKATTR